MIGKMMIPSDLLSSVSSDSGDGGIAQSLSDLAASTVQNIADNAAQAATDRIVSALNPVSSSNTAPTPDFAANAAKPQAGFTNATVAGVSLPLVMLIIGGALYYGMKK